MVKYLDSNIHGERISGMYGSAITHGISSPTHTPGAGSVSCALRRSFALIVGVPCLLCSLAMPRVWSFLRVTHPRPPTKLRILMRASAPLRADWRYVTALPWIMTHRPHRWGCCSAAPWPPLRARC